MSDLANLFVLLDPTSLSDEELEDFTRQLREEMREAGIAIVTPVTGTPPPQGAKAGGIENIGMLAVQAAPAAIPALVGLLSQWSQRARGRTVHLRAKMAGGELELDYPVGSMKQDELKQFVETVTGVLKEGAGSEG